MLKPIPFLNMAQKAATFDKLIKILTLWREKLKKKVVVEQIVFPTPKKHVPPFPSSIGNNIISLSPDMPLAIVNIYTLFLP
jgi:hypothetical protein